MFNDPPSSWDWRSVNNVMGRAKDQGNCGGSHAFTTAYVVGAHFGIEMDRLRTFSKQQIVDCCYRPRYKAYGCSGGWVDHTLRYANDLGMMIEKAYPFKARQQK